MATITVTGVPDGYGVVIIDAEQSNGGFDYSPYAFLDQTPGPHARPTGGVVQLPYTPVGTKVAVIVHDDSGFIGTDYFQMTGQGGSWDAEIGFEIKGITEPQVIAGDATIHFPDFAFANTPRLQHLGHVKTVVEYDNASGVTAYFDSPTPPVYTVERRRTLQGVWSTVNETAPFDTYRPGWIGSIATMGYDASANVQAVGFEGVVDWRTLHNDPPDNVSRYPFHTPIWECDAGWNPEHEYPNRVYHYQNHLWHNPKDYVVKPGGYIWFHGGWHVGQWDRTYSPQHDFSFWFPNGGVFKKGWVYWRFPVFRMYEWQDDVVAMYGGLRSSLDMPMVMSVGYTPPPVTFDFILDAQTSSPASGSGNTASSGSGTGTNRNPASGSGSTTSSGSGEGKSLVRQFFDFILDAVIITPKPASGSGNTASSGSGTALTGIGKWKVLSPNRNTFASFRRAATRWRTVGSNRSDWSIR